MPNNQVGGNAVVRADTAKTTESAATIGAADAALVSANTSRVGVYICNTHASNDVYLSLGGTAQTAKGIYLKAAGGSVYISDYTGAIRAFATAGSTVVTFCEV